MELAAAVTAIADSVAVAIARQLAPMLREQLAEHTCGCSCTGSPKTRAGAPPRTAYTVAEVARSLGVSTKHIYRLRDLGEIRTVRVGRRHLVTVEAFADFLGEQPDSPRTAIP